MRRSVVGAAPLLLSAGVLACNGLLGITQLDGADGGVSSDAAPETPGDAESDVTPDDAADVDPSCNGLPDPGPATTCFPRPSGLVSWWRGEGNTKDSAGPNDGTVTNVGYAPGYVGRALHFNGNGYVTAPATGFPVGSDDRTMEAWVRPTVTYPTPASNQGLFVGYGVWQVSDKLSALLDCYTTADNAVLFTQWGKQIGGGTLEPGVWHHVAMRLAGGVVRVYLDGSLRPHGVRGGNLARIADRAERMEPRSVSGRSGGRDRGARRRGARGRRARRIRTGRNRARAEEEEENGSVSEFAHHCRGVLRLARSQNG